MEGMGLQWAIIAAYVGFIFVKGVLKGRQIQHSDDYLLAGRNVGWLLLFTTLGATVIGGGYSVGAVARTYEWGLLMVLVSVGGYLHFVFSGLVVAPAFRRAELYTVAGYFKLRYDERTRRLVLILSLAFSVFIVAAQVAAIGSVLASLLGDAVADPRTLTWAIVVGGAVVIVYSSAGGLLAVIATDVYQFVVLFAGFLLTLAIVLPQLVGHWTEVKASLPPEFFTIDGGKGWLFLVTTFLAFLLGETFAPGYVTRYCIGRNIAETKKGIAGVGFVLSGIFPLIILVIALYARWKMPDIDPQYALAGVIRHLHNPWIGGLMIAALLSAVMSSADSALNSATTIFVKDLLEDELGRDDLPDRKRISVARWLTIGLGAVSTAVAVLWPDIIDLLLFTYHIWAPGIILPVVVGVLSKRRDRVQNRAIFWTMLVSVASALAWRGTPWAAFADPAVVGVGVSILVYLLLLRKADPGLTGETRPA